MRRLLPALTTAIAVFAVPGVAMATPPVPTATTVTNLTATGATLNGTVNPSGADTTVTFLLSTNADLSSPTLIPLGSPVPSGASPVPVSVPTGVLSTNTTYYFAVRANNGDGGNIQNPAAAPFPEFTPAASPFVATTGAFSNITSTSAQVVGTVTPNGLPTQVRFRYGTATGSTNYTAPVAVGSGTTTIPAQATITGLPAYTRIYYTTRASRIDPYPNDTQEGAQQSFVTDRLLTGITAKASRVTYSGTSTISGTVSGAGNSGANLEVYSQPYPYTGAFTKILEGKSGTSGTYNLRLGNNIKNTKIRVNTSGSSVVTSPITTLYVATRIGLTIKKKGSKRVFTGTVRPKLGSGARAKVQRKSGKKWITVRTLRLTEQSAASSRYTTTLSRRKKTSYRVQVSAGSSSYATGVSTTRKVK